MADASFVQTSFLGGEWSPFAQGRFTDDRYRTGMNVSLNGYPIETGAWVRRVGTRFLACTRGGQPAALIPFNFAQDAPYGMEFTNGKVRFFNKNGLVLAEAPRIVTAFSHANPAVVTTFAAPTTWANGDTVVFDFPAAGVSQAGSVLLGRQFVLTLTSGNVQFSLIDAVTGVPLDGSTFTWDTHVPMQVSRVLELTTPYTGSLWQDLNYVQDEDTVLLLHPTIRPYTIQGTGGCLPGQDIFQINPAYFVDGPYLDPVTDNSYFTPSAQTGEITITLGYPAWSSTTVYPNGSIFQPQGPKTNGTTTYTPRYVDGSMVVSGGITYVSIKDNNLNKTPASNATYWRAIADGAVIGPTGFVAADVGRLIRLNSEPADWTATTYAAGALVKYQREYYLATAAVLATDIPGQDPLKWGIATNAARWTWGIITSRTSALAAKVSLVGGDLLYSTTVRDWRLGAWADSLTWPTNGTYHEGRFWLGGAIPNRFDGTKALRHYDMTPTAPDGTVADDNAIAYVFDSPVQSQIVWMIPDDLGIIAGTSSGEWLIQASSLNDPLTPTSIQAHQATSYGCADIAPLRAGQTLIFAQRLKKALFEYLPGNRPGKFVGKNITADASHLSIENYAEIAYQPELNPIIWARMDDGSLIGTTYKREEDSSVQPPTFNGWHRHELGNGRLVRSLVAGPSPDGLTTTVTMVTNDDNGVHYVEQMTQAQTENATVYNSWFLDSATNPKGAQVQTINGVEGLTLSGLWHLNSSTVAAMIGGYDAGDFTVSNGSIFVPFDNTLTQAFLATVADSGADISGLSVAVNVVSALPAQALQMYQEPAIFTTLSYTASNTFSIPDYASDRVFLVAAGNGPDVGIARMTLSTGDLELFATNATIWGIPIPADWDAATIYNASPRVLATDGNIYSSAIDGNAGFNPATDTASRWTLVYAIPSIFAIGTTYSAGARVATTDGTFKYYRAVINLAGSRDPLADDGTQWLEITAPTTGTPPTWSQALTFNAGDLAKRENLTGLYSSVGSGNVGHNPVGDAGVHWTALGTLPAKWDYATAYRSGTFVTGSNAHQYSSVSNTNVGHDPVSDAGVHWTDINSGPSRFSGNVDYALGFDGFLYATPTSGTPSSTFAKIDPETLTQVAQGASAINPFAFVMTQAGARNYLVSTQFGVATIGLFDADAMMDHPLSKSWTVDEGQRGRIVSGQPGACRSRVCIMGLSYNGSYSSGQVVGFYTFDIDEFGDITFTKAGTIAPAAVDATWTTFNANTDGIAFDQTDGNILVLFGSTAGSPTTTNYIAKINMTNGALMWKVAINSALAGAATCMKFSQIKNNEFVFLSNNASVTPYQAYYINTNDGSSTAYTVKGMPSGATQIYNDATGVLTTNTNFSQTTGSPTLGPNTPTSFHQWANLTIGRAHTEHAVPGVVGYTYTSEGQVLRPERPEEAGSRNGPAMGKTRRSHMFAMRLFNTSPGLSVGTTFDRMRPLNIKNNRAVAQAANVLYTDEFWDTLEDGYSFSSMLAWKASRAYPATVLAITQFLHTQDR